MKAPGFYGERRQVGGRARARDLLRFNMGTRKRLRHEHALADAAAVYHVLWSRGRSASEGNIEPGLDSERWGRRVRSKGLGIGLVLISWPSTVLPTSLLAL